MTHTAHGAPIRNSRPNHRAPVLVADNVSVTIGEQYLIDHLDLEVYPGEVVALVGPNGAGKSTFLATLTGDTTPSTGTVTLYGTDLSELRPAQMARLRAVQLQENRVAFAFTASEVVRLGRAAWAGTGEEARDDAVVYEVMHATEVTPLAQRAYPQLSGGEKARTTFARTLAQETRMLLLDEPTAAMDIRHQEHVLSHVRQRANAGAAVVVVIHDLSVAVAYADRIMMISNGRHIRTGTPKQVLTAQLITEVYGHPVDVLQHPTNGELIIAPVRDRPRRSALSPTPSPTTSGSRTHENSLFH